MAGHGEQMAGRPVVYLVGAGPGDPELLTLRAARLIAQADWLIHDALIEPAVLELAVRAKRIAAGKRAGRPSARQQEINRQMIVAARSGGVVVRLKGGDPLIFARAREEIDALVAAGIEPVIVPGITAAQAAYAALGEPMTERGDRRSVVLATPQVQQGAVADTEWARPVINAQGGALYMAASVVPRVRATLLALGLSAATPVAWVADASRAGQTAIRSRLGELRAPEGLPSGAPVILLVGLARTGAAPGVAVRVPPLSARQQAADDEQQAQRIERRAEHDA
ncbi:MAG: uroporphyrinogen-III C-methyltransferase [Lautropia sp. SCN 66-9]|nr:MAG: uroporphyrinogen-III C-methyltransferase [Lautropia sp. SCN 66-9]